MSRWEFSRSLRLIAQLKCTSLGYKCGVVLLATAGPTHGDNDTARRVDGHKNHHEASRFFIIHATNSGRFRGGGARDARLAIG